MRGRKRNPPAPLLASRRRALARPVARRTANLLLPDGSSLSVAVSLWPPAKCRGQDDYACGYEVVGLGAKLAGRIVGYDSVQAIQLALRYIGCTIARLTPPGSRWECAEDNLGFPCSP